MRDTWWVKPEQLDDDQKIVVALSKDKSYLILGPPGSGKSNLLLLRANYMVRAGKPDVLILVFTRTLQEFLKTGGSQYAFSSDKIKTSISWMKDILRQYGISFNDRLSFNELRSYLIQKVESVVTSNKLKNIYDCILLDEAQDYLEREIKLFKILGKVLFVTADSRQKIYDGENPVENIKNIVDDTHSLKYHYRNGVKICLLADEVGKKFSDYEPMINTSQYNEKTYPSSVKLFKLGTIEEQCDEIMKVLDTQLKAYPEELIGIISPVNEVINKIWNIFSKSKYKDLCIFQSSTEGYISFDPNKNICICTGHSAKGLEFRALHLVGFESIKNFRSPRRLAFTCITRAKTSLSAYHTENLPGFIEGAFAAIEPPTKLPELKDCFGGA